MKTPWLTALICLAFLAVTPRLMAQATSQSGDTQVLEGMIRKAWDDYKNKNKEAFARILTEDVIEVEEGAEAAHDRKATLAEMDEFNLQSVSLSDFHYRPIGSNGMLVRYNVEYAAQFGSENIHNKSIIGELWEKTAGGWKLFYFQETKTK